VSSQYKRTCNTSAKYRVSVLYAVEVVHEYRSTEFCSTLSSSCQHSECHQSVTATPLSLPKCAECEPRCFGSQSHVPNSQLQLSWRLRPSDSAWTVPLQCRAVSTFEFRAPFPPFTVHFYVFESVTSTTRPLASDQTQTTRGG
jgi:hypothetical protein